MFVSLPAYEYPMPLALEEPGSTFWRAISLPLQLPWFILTYLESDGEEQTLRSACLCFETDLVGMIQAPQGRTIVAAACLMPGWMSNIGHWQSREIARIWRGRDERAHPVFVFEDVEGKDLFPVRRDPGEVHDRELIFQRTPPEAQ